MVPSDFFGSHSLTLLPLARFYFVATIATLRVLECLVPPNKPEFRRDASYVEPITREQFSGLTTRRSDSAQLTRAVVLGTEDGV